MCFVLHLGFHFNFFGLFFFLLFVDLDFLLAVAEVFGSLLLLFARLLGPNFVWLGLFHLVLGLHLLNLVGVRRVALALDVNQDVPLALYEERVLENLVVRQLGLALVEVVHVQLPDERREVPVFEILWKNALTKQVLAFDLEAFPSFSPRDDVVKLSLLDDFVEFKQEAGHVEDSVVTLVHDLVVGLAVGHLLHGPQAAILVMCL